MQRTTMTRTKTQIMKRTEPKKKTEWSFGGHVPDSPKDCPYHFSYQGKRWTDCAMCYRNCNPDYCEEAKQHLRKTPDRKNIRIMPREGNGKGKK
jgi:hypothetical protein